MAAGRFEPVQGAASQLFHYFHMIEDWADETGTATPLLDRAAELYQRCIDMGYGETHDVAVMVDVIRSLSRSWVGKKEKNQ
jgi:3-hydroxyisobutyrate dehydrogenase-like beta-hydroxyacid dehydrogenase